MWFLSRIHEKCKILTDISADQFAPNRSNKIYYLSSKRLYVMVRARN